MKIVKQLVRGFLNCFGPGRTYLRLRSLQPLLTENGWLRSVQEGVPCDLQGRPIPWYTYPCIRFLEGRVKKEMTVFEYGSGHSTLWWSERVQRVVACEHDQAWYQSLSPRLPAHVSYHFCTEDHGEAYCGAISPYPAAFDVVIIDGMDRVNCASYALQGLKEGGVILWDNSDWTKFDEGMNYLMEQGFKRLDFWGMGAINAYAWCTSVFYRPNNVFGI